MRGGERAARATRRPQGLLRAVLAAAGDCSARRDGADGRLVCAGRATSRRRTRTRSARTPSRPPRWLKSAGDGARNDPQPATSAPWARCRRPSPRAVAGAGDALVRRPRGGGAGRARAGADARRDARAVTGETHDETHEETKIERFRAAQNPQSAAAVDAAEPTARRRSRDRREGNAFRRPAARRRAGRTWCARKACPTLWPRPRPRPVSERLGTGAMTDPRPSIAPGDAFEQTARRCARPGGATVSCGGQGARAGCIPACARPGRAGCCRTCSGRRTSAASSAHRPLRGGAQAHRERAGVRRRALGRAHRGWTRAAGAAGGGRAARAAAGPTQRRWSC